MVRLRFMGFSVCEDGKMGSFETTGEEEIPVNIFIDNYEEVKYMKPQLCYVDVSAVDRGVYIYESESDLPKSETDMAPYALIPVGTFPAETDDEHFELSPDIMFSGIVREVEVNPDPGEDDPNLCLTIRSLDIEFDLYIQYDGTVKPGYYVQGVAWLYGDIYPAV